MKFDFLKIFNFTTFKIITTIVVLLFLYSQWNNILDKIESKPSPKPQVIMIEDNAARIELTESRKQVEKLREELKALDSKILKVVKERNEKIDEIGKITAKLEQSVKLNQKSSHVYLKGKVTDHHFIKIYKTASDGTKFPIAWAMFHPNQPDPNKLWKTGTYPIEFHTKIIETENDQGTYNRYVELNVENNQMKETKGNRYPLKITELKWAKNVRKDKKFYLWNPRLGLGALATNDIMAPKIDLSFSSYGKTKRDMDWRFAIIGIGVSNHDDNDEDFIFEFTPMQWNFGTKLPLIENIFIGPSIGWDTSGDTSYGVSLSIPF